MRRLWLVMGCCVCLGAFSPAEAGLWDRIFGTPERSSIASGLDLAVDTVPPLSEAPTASPATVIAPILSAASDYKMGPGDRLMVTVFNEKDLSVDTRLSDAGTLSFPLLGEIRAQGMTIGMLQDYLTEQLRGSYLVNPQVYVSILEYRQFFVNGEVSKPGGLPFQPGLTVRKAIALAGGFTARASHTKIFIIQEDDPFGRPRPVTLDAILRPGDILTVEQSFF